MAWTDKPTEKQIKALYGYMWGPLSRELTLEALDWLMANTTRKEASDELKRLHDLCGERKLHLDTVLDSPVWDEFKKTHDVPTQEEPRIPDHLKKILANF